MNSHENETRPYQWFYRTENGRLLRGEVPGELAARHSEQVSGDVLSDLDLALALTGLHTVEWGRFALTNKPLINDWHDRWPVTPQDTACYRGLHVARIEPFDMVSGWHHPIYEFQCLVAEDAEGRRQILVPIDDMTGLQEPGRVPHTTWGYNGQGPHQSALTILAHALGEEFAVGRPPRRQWLTSDAIALHRALVEQVVSQLPQDEDVLLPAADLRYWIQNQRATPEWAGHLAFLAEELAFEREMARLNQEELAAQLATDEPHERTDG